MSDLTNGLRHIADDHPCCRETLQLTIDTIEQLETENADISHAYGVTRDVVKGLCEELANLKAENAALRSLLREAITDHVSPYDLPESEDYIARVKTALGEDKP